MFFYSLLKTVRNKWSIFGFPRYDRKGSSYTKMHTKVHCKKYPHFSHENYSKIDQNGLDFHTQRFYKSHKSSLLPGAQEGRYQTYRREVFTDVL